MIHNIQNISARNLRRDDGTKQSVLFDNSYISMAVSDVPPGHHNWQLCQDSRLWWDKDRHQHKLYVAEVTIIEIKAGTILQQVNKRLDLIRGIEVLPATKEVDDFADALVDARVIGAESLNDAKYIATCFLHGVNVLLTINMKDMANADSIQKLNIFAKEHNITPPKIRTPHQMLYNKGELVD